MGNCIIAHHVKVKIPSAVSGVTGADDTYYEIDTIDHFVDANYNSGTKQVTLTRSDASTLVTPPANIKIKVK